MFSVLRPESEQWELMSSDQLKEIAEGIATDNNENYLFYTLYLKRIGWRIQVA